MTPDLTKRLLKMLHLTCKEFKSQLREHDSMHGRERRKDRLFADALEADIAECESLISSLKTISGSDVNS